MPEKEVISHNPESVAVMVDELAASRSLVLVWRTDKAPDE